MLWPWSSLLLSHSNYKQNRAIATTPNYTCIVVRQVRVVLVVMNAPFPPYPSETEPKKVDCNHQPPTWQLCVKAPWAGIRIVGLIEQHMCLFNHARRQMISKQKLQTSGTGVWFKGERDVTRNHLPWMCVVVNLEVDVWFWCLGADKCIWTSHLTSPVCCGGQLCMWFREPAFLGNVLSAYPPILPHNTHHFSC